MSRDQRAAVRRVEKINMSGFHQVLLGIDPGKGLVYVESRVPTLNGVGKQNVAHILWKEGEVLPRAFRWYFLKIAFLLWIGKPHRLQKLKGPKMKPPKDG